MLVALSASLSRDLTLRHGKGFSRSNLFRFRQFFAQIELVSLLGATLDQWRLVTQLQPRNVNHMRLLYLHYQKGQKPSDLLSWSHHVELLRIEDPLERSFYSRQKETLSDAKRLIEMGQITEKINA